MALTLAMVSLQSARGLEVGSGQSPRVAPTPRVTAVLRHPHPRGAPGSSLEKHRIALGQHRCRPSGTQKPLWGDPPPRPPAAALPGMQLRSRSSGQPANPTPPPGAARRPSPVTLLYFSFFLCLAVAACFSVSTSSTSTQGGAGFCVSR